MSKTITPGTLFLISAPSGAGKTSLVNALIEQSSQNSGQQLCVSVSHTTRAKRPGEVDGENYFFVTKEEFRSMRDDNRFLEHAEVFDNLYGTSGDWVNSKLAQGWDVILEIDWQGAAQIKTLAPDSVSIFILPPSISILRERLTGRGQDQQETIDKRMAEAVNEMLHHDEADYLIVNDNFEAALQDLQCIIRSRSLTIERQKQAHQALLDELLSRDSN